MNLAANSQFALRYSSQDNRLELCDLADKNSRPIRIDFLSQKLQHRRKSLVGSRELIAKAVGHRKGMVLKVLDATAGFGVDAFMLACLGHDVTMLERSSLIAALLQDGLTRVLAADPYKDLKLRLINTNAITYMQHLGKDVKPDVVYLDPMYPERTKTALNKKNMRILKEIVGEDLDVIDLFKAALLCAKKRVVVKRPRLAKRIDEGILPCALVPTFVISGKSCRYDVYQVS